MKTISNEEIKKVAELVSLEPALLKTVQVVESGNSGFLTDGRPVILFEGHIMYRELKKKFGLEKANEAFEKHPSTVHPKWDKSNYRGGELEYIRLEIAKTIDEECALKSASWGMFQIMGFNHKLCGCKDVFTFVKKMNNSASDQLQMMVYFLNNSGSLRFLKEKNWEEFAKRYNGAGYKQNAYDQKLRNTYENFKNKI